MSTISWDETTPTDASNASGADDEIRSMLTAIATGLGESFEWPGSGGGSAASGGELKLGSARMAIHDGTRPVGNKPDGFLGVEEDNSRVWHIGTSGGTQVITDHAMLVHHTDTQFTNIGNAPFTARWVNSTGTFLADSSGRTDAVTFTTTFDAQPFVMVTPQSGGISLTFAITAVSGSGFSFVKHWIGSGSTDDVVCSYLAEGVVSL